MFDQPKGLPPVIHPLTRHTRAGLIIGGIMIWVLLFAVIIGIVVVVSLGLATAKVVLLYLIVNTICMSSAMFYFNLRRYQISDYLEQTNKHGSARLADYDDLAEFLNETEGIYIGGTMMFNDRGHLLTVAGTRGGKGTNLIVPNMLDAGGGFKGSWVVVDPKGEAVAICANYQKKLGKDVYVINPWNLLDKNVPQSSSYNPFDLLADKNSIHLIDDAQIIAEMLVPIDAKEVEKFFTDVARSIVVGLIAYIAFTKDSDERNLTTLYKMIRFDEAAWEEMLGDMNACQVEGGNGDVISLISEEIRKVTKSGEKTFGIILTTMLQATDFIKSPALQDSLKSGFDPKALSNGNVVLYVIIPADKLTSHSRWLRLVVMTLIRSVVRNPSKTNRTCFLLDEFASLGYISEIETAFGTYAGYGVTIWPVFQSLIQLQSIYEKVWESFIANATVRHFFSINDNFTADYVSVAMGNKSNVLKKKKGKADEEYDTNSRPLMTPDEIRRESGRNIIAFISDKPPAVFPKLPYYEMPFLHPDGQPVYDPNPYI